MKKALIEYCPICRCSHTPGRHVSARQHKIPGSSIMRSKKMVNIQPTKQAANTRSATTN